MGRIILVILIAVIGVTAILRPWIGIASYYLLAILGPQYIWWWVFEGVRVSFVVAGLTILGVCSGLLRGIFDFSFLKTRMNLYVFWLWVFLVISYLFGPFVDQYASAGRTPAQLFSIINKIFLFYFCSVLIIDDLKKVRYLLLIMAASAIYLIFWANDQYFAGNWNQFNMGRLMGPHGVDGGAIYFDENVFAMFFVTGLPVLFYLIEEIRTKWLCYLGWAVIPLGWHAVFLTGSRGGLIGIGVTILLTAVLNNKRYLAIPMLLGALLFYQWQAGTTMKGRSEIIADYQGDRSARDRLDAWGAGLKMIMAHPVTGVGLDSFITALPHVIVHRPMVAHNTLIQFAAESGIGAGACYIMLILTFYRNAYRLYLLCRRDKVDKLSKQIDRYNKASLVSFTGLVVCSLFLSLNTYEIFFFLLIINNSLVCISLRRPVSA
ncbi:MAG: O-antigen ligase family protein [Desulfobacteraceae bacterium]|nr:O-antigen ligase family protein [Desulfobacteraceae bacterium]